MTRRRGRSPRSRIVEFAFVLVLVAAIWVFIVAGGPMAFGQLLGPMIAPK